MNITIAILIFLAAIFAVLYIKRVPIIKYLYKKIIGDQTTIIMASDNKDKNV